MKKIIMTACLIASSSAYTQSLEQRVEALEFKSYEQFFKVSGSLEYRFDSYERKVGLDYSTTAPDPANANNLLLNSSKAGSEENSSFNRLFFNLDLESKPTDSLSFFGRLAMRKYFGMATVTGTAPSKGGFNDFVGPGGGDSQNISVDRAFFNYKMSDNFTLTVGRLPTNFGSPKHFNRNEAIGGNYPTLMFAGLFDGLAGTYSLNANNRLKFIYTPFSHIDFDKNTNSRQFTSYTALYEYGARTSWTRRLDLTLGYFHFNKFYVGAGAAGGAEADVSKYAANLELLGIADSKFDVAIHGAYSKVKNTSVMAFSGNGAGWHDVGWFTDKKEGKPSGHAYGALVRYNLTADTKLGAEYLSASKDSFVYDITSLDIFNFYAIKGSGVRVFVNHELDQNIGLTLGYMRTQQDYQNFHNGVLGPAIKTDNTLSSVYASLVARF